MNQWSQYNQALRKEKNLTKEKDLTVLGTQEAKSSLSLIFAFISICSCLTFPTALLI